MYIENKVSDSESKQYHFPDIYFQDITEIHNNKEFSVKRRKDAKLSHQLLRCISKNDLYL